MTIKLNQVKELAEKLGTVEEILREQKKVASQKCRHKKMKGLENYEQKMTEILTYEQLLKEAKDYLSPKKVTVTTMSWEQIQELTYDETVKAIKSIQSKKCNTQYLTTDVKENVEYQEAVRIEEMLKKHRENIKPLENAVSKNNVNDLIEHVSNLETVDKDYVLKLLEQLKQK